MLLVGPPKIGKSWLVLTVALAAAAGGKALSITIPKRPVLYLALEDGDRRLQDRCRKLLRGDPIPREFEYLLRLEQGRVIDTITAWLDREHDLPPLVILDTLGKVMPPALLGESSYQRDYRIGTTLKRIADDHAGMCLLTNHHDRKAAAEDWVDTVSGTHGLAGAADTVIVLTRARHETSGLLRVTGRDVPEGEYALTVADGFAWDLDGADLEEAAARAREARLSGGVSDRSAEIIASWPTTRPASGPARSRTSSARTPAATSSAWPTPAASGACPAASTPVSQVSHRPNPRSARASNGTTGHRRPKPRRSSDQAMGHWDTWDTWDTTSRCQLPAAPPVP